MKWYNDTKGRYEELELNKHDEDVMKIAEAEFSKHPEYDDIKLYNAVEHYYSKEKGVMNARLQKVIEYCVKRLTENREEK